MVPPYNGELGNHKKDENNSNVLIWSDLQETLLMKNHGAKQCIQYATFAERDKRE